MTKKNISRRTCACMHVHYRLCDQNPNFRVEQTNIEDFTKKFVEGASKIEQRVVPVKIPVVVHVVYRTTSEKISKKQIESQMTVLNKDFRAQNEDIKKVPEVWQGIAADAGIEFYLADKDPCGKKSNGITYTKTKQTSFNTDDNIKSSKEGGIDAWPTDRYLNIWVCTLGNGLLGYAQFPGGPVDTDGIVVLNQAFGTTGSAQEPFNHGRTTVHEIGHWLNLHHIWGDLNACGGTDFVDDTPEALLPNYGEPTFPHVSCDNGPNGDMFMNYMDYVDDVAMYMFTKDQVQRMTATLAGPRQSILRS